MLLTQNESIQIQNGELVFASTDVEVAILFNYLKAGRSIEAFLEEYPEVNPGQVNDVMDAAEEQLKSALTL